MSWNIATDADADNVPAALDEVIAASPDAVAAAGPQLAAARSTAIDLAAAVTRPGDRVHVSANGHYNPDNEPRDGWANSAITVGVTQLPAAVTTPTESTEQATGTEPADAEPEITGGPSPVEIG